MVKKKSSDENNVEKVKKKDENIDLVEEHLNLAEQILNEEAKKCLDSGLCSEKKQKAIIKAQFDLEKAEAELEEVEEE